MVKAKKVNYENAWYALAVARVLLGFVFLWAFLDKTMGLGFSTAHEKAWILGGSPTSGFLGHVQGPFADIFQGMVGNPVIDWLFMFGLLGLGLSLMLGIGLRVAAVGGTILLAMMWSAEFPTAGTSTNPLVDSHIIYIAMLWTFATGQRKFSLINTWLQTSYVKKNPWLW